MRRIRSLILWWLGLAVFVMALVILDGMAYDLQPEKEEIERGFQLPSSAVSLLSFGARPLVADYLWIDAVQYLGKTLAKHKHETVGGKVVEVGFMGEGVPIASQTFFDLATRITEVDPYFKYPYQLGALFLADPHGDPELAIKLLAAGVDRNPDDWELRLWYGFQLFMIRGDREAAVKQLDIAVTLYGCPDHVGRINKFLSTGSKRNLARLFLHGALRRAKTRVEREQIMKQISDLESGIDVDEAMHQHHTHHDHHDFDRE